jgi:hydroxylamine dehydrogenase
MPQVDIHRKKKIWITALSLICLFFLGFKRPVTAPTDNEPLSLLSDQTEECLECHRLVTPGIVADWMASEHAHAIPAEAMKKPENLREVSVGCYECHSLNASNHKDNFEHFDHRINVVVTPRDCATCHQEEVEQYLPSIKANAYFNLEKNAVYHTLVETITSVKNIQNGNILQRNSSEDAKAETCLACHGTVVEVEGVRTIETELGEIEVPDLSNWPNQGVGRINPDGTPGACTACHPRHSFSVEVARKPGTCSQCHLEPDVPAWNVYRESKHGNIYEAKNREWDWKSIPWVVGKDFTAPTCATCHNSLLVSPEGDIVAERNHDFGARLWVRIFGLIYSHPQPKSGQTFGIKNQDGLPLPASFSGNLASDFLLDKQEQKNRQDKMMKVCRTCHGTSWVSDHFARFHSTLKETDMMVEASTRIILDAWEQGLADRSNPFDESLEQKWISQWLFYANSVRYASAMMGPDYAAFKNGWWDLTKNLQEMKDLIALKTAIKK